MDFVLRNLDKPLDFKYISCHKNITWEHVKQYPNIPWNYRYLSQNPNITLDIALENPEARDSSGKTWRWKLFLKNDFTLNTLDLIYNKTGSNEVYLMLHSQWDFITFLLNMKLSQYQLENNDLLRIERKMNKLSIWEVISENKTLTPELIRYFRDKPFNWKFISLNVNITLDLVSELIDKPWNWSAMSVNKTLTPELIRHFRDKPFDWEKTIPTRKYHVGAYPRINR